MGQPERAPTAGSPAETGQDVGKDSDDESSVRSDSSAQALDSPSAKHVERMGLRGNERRGRGGEVQGASSSSPSVARDESVESRGGEGSVEGAGGSERSEQSESTEGQGESESEVDDPEARIDSATSSPDPLDILPPIGHLAHLENDKDAFISLVATMVKQGGDLFQLPSDDPRSWKEAMAHPDAEHWKRKALEEVHDLEVTYGVVEVVSWSDVPEHGRVLRPKFVHTTKYGPDGKVLDHKSRLVAMGDRQVENEDYYDTFSPVLKYPSLRTLIALAASHGLHIEQCDINKAYLHGALDVDHLYLSIPEGIVDLRPELRGKVFHLRKALYGLRQAGRAWNTELDTTIASIGYKRLWSDACVYAKSASPKGKIADLVGVYVDDTIHLASTKEEVVRQKEALKSKYGVKERARPVKLLGVEFRYGRDGDIFIGQEAYINKLYAKYHPKDTPHRKVWTPMEPSLVLPNPDPTAMTRADHTAYQQLIGALQYAANTTRPDACHAVNVLSRANRGPTPAHFKAAHRILSYLHTTADLGLIYEHGVKEKDGFEAYVDSSWGDDRKTSRSSYGGVVKLAGAAVAWCAKLEKRVALSTVEAEYLAASDWCREVIWTGSLLSELGRPIVGPLPLKCDNTGAGAVSKDPAQHNKMRHVRIAEHHLREVVQNKEVSLVHVETAEQVADIFTKPLARERLEQHRLALGLRSHSSMGGC